MDLLAGIVIGVGLASVAGVRALLPLVGMLSIVPFAGFGNPPYLFVQINNWLNLPVILALLVLLVVEGMRTSSPRSARASTGR